MRQGPYPASIGSFIGRWSGASRTEQSNTKIFLYELHNTLEPQCLMPRAMKHVVTAISSSARLSRAIETAQSTSTVVGEERR